MYVILSYTFLVSTALFIFAWIFLMPRRTEQKPKKKKTKQKGISAQSKKKKMPSLCVLVLIFRWF